MSESFTLQNTGRGQIAFMLNPPVHMEDGMPKHKRRKALRENVQSIVIPQAGSVDLVEKTGLTVKVLRQLPEVLTILRNPNVRWVEDVHAPTAPPVEEKPAPPPPVEAPKPAPVPVEPEPVREAVVPPPPAPPVEEPKPAPEPVKVLEAPPAAMPAGLPPGAAPAAPEPVRTGKVKGGKNTAKGNSKP